MQEIYAQSHYCNGTGGLYGKAKFLCVRFGLFAFFLRARHTESLDDQCSCHKHISQVSQHKVIVLLTTLLVEEPGPAAARRLGSLWIPFSAAPAPAIRRTSS